MSSSSSEEVVTSATSVAVDRRVVMERGQAIVDSIVTSNDPEVIDASLRNILAAFQAMINGGNLNLVEITDMGSELLAMVDRSQVSMSDTAQNALREGMHQFEGLLRENRLNVELVDDVQERAFDLTQSAVEIIAETKTGDFMALSRTVMTFSLLMLATSGWILKGK